MPEWMVTRPLVAAHPALEEKQALNPGEVRKRDTEAWRVPDEPDRPARYYPVRNDRYPRGGCCIENRTREFG